MGCLGNKMCELVQLSLNLFHVLARGHHVFAFGWFITPGGAVSAVDTTTNDVGLASASSALLRSNNSHIFFLERIKEVPIKSTLRANAVSDNDVLTVPAHLITEDKAANGGGQHLHLHDKIGEDVEEGLLVSSGRLESVPHRFELGEGIVGLLSSSLSSLLPVVT